MVCQSDAKVRLQCVHQNQGCATPRHTAPQRGRKRIAKSVVYGGSMHLSAIDLASNRMRLQRLRCRVCLLRPHAAAHPAAIVIFIGKFGVYRQP